MAAESDRIGKISTSPDRSLLLLGMTAVEKLSELFIIEAEVVARGGPVDLHPCLSKPVSFTFQGKPHVSRHFHGILCEYVEVGRSNDDQDFVYRLVIRPQQYISALNRMSKIHFKSTMVNILGLLAPQRHSLSASYSAIEYRVQYDESDFAFASRHMEREGIYYFFEHAEGSHTLVAVDAPAAHTAGTPATVRLGGGTPDGREALLFSLREHRRFGPTAYTVDDYDYEKSTVVLKKQKQVTNLGAGASRWRSGTASDVGGTIAERFEYPGHYDQPGLERGARYANVRIEADRAEMARSHAEGDVFAAAVGRKLTVAFDESGNGHSFNGDQEYLIVATRHHYHAAGYRSGSGGNEDMRVELELMPVRHPYRPALNTPMPRIAGPQTAVVVGPPGEEVFTDKYGRIKVKFFWDIQRYEDGGQVPDRSIWVRVAQMSAGSGYGAFMIPRIGHEVVVEFLNGDPDRPLVTGSVYNDGNLPAFGSAAANPLQGIRTNSTKGGGGFNEIRLDDTKDSEVFSVQAQKDLKTLVLKGDETRDIKEGKRTTTIKSDETLTIQDGNRQETLEKGNDSLDIKQGNRAATLDMGNDKLQLNMGNRAIKLDTGKQETEAMQSIELKVGSSSIKIDQTGITIKGIMIKIEATAMFQTKGAMMQQQASAIHIVKGAMVMIN
ncbi:type VI secretion protein [Polymorphobacter multimanifer]|uniref:Type VI secretion system secreted protein VgrG n=1 Tax=Polymorphobacter multimanifer TaxID=1070431 RepID=A0A841L494_9SPHN|nr:type VI secretion system tip protein TssI/VgrG [Polymorphobacter multimanifer]MBB6227454.1 type VI secretion system secreted protein VgrG [Polymorphobacter multimanifer]GGI68103.1 type VI secretion protein [Polymorphobacter multimanifer]